MLGHRHTLAAALAPSVVSVPVALAGAQGWLQGNAGRAWQRLLLETLGQHTDTVRLRVLLNTGLLSDLVSTMLSVQRIDKVHIRKHLKPSGHCIHRHVIRSCTHVALTKPVLNLHVICQNGRPKLICPERLTRQSTRIQYAHVASCTHLTIIPTTPIATKTSSAPPFSATLLHAEGHPSSNSHPQPQPTKPAPQHQAQEWLPPPSHCPISRVNHLRPVLHDWMYDR